MRRLLLDTHALLWCLADDPALSARARRAVLEPSAEVNVSAASAWEIATKVRLGRLPDFAAFAVDLDALLSKADYRLLPISFRHGQRAGSYPTPVKDPFDRMLAAQAEIESLALVTADAAFTQFPVTTLW
ncbi:MAG: type II toxin-antitoxin system VapC family toxin [Acidimicrobiaceae bacterium]|nr:type II toxin-antitoxin system VapC family toxin [Acidimicrobiaceae bacterium]